MDIHLDDPVINIINTYSNMYSGQISDEAMNIFSIELTPYMLNRTIYLFLTLLRARVLDTGHINEEDALEITKRLKERFGGAIFVTKIEK